MKVPYGEGLASHTDPESCVYTCKGIGEALTGDKDPETDQSVDPDSDCGKHETERSYFKELPTSFKLESDEVDKLRGAARRLLRESDEFLRLLKDLKAQKF